MNDLATVPTHVDPAHVRDYDIYGDAIFADDPHLAFARMRDTAPGIFWTPANEGHWVVLDPKLMDTVLRTPEYFSNSQTSIPARADAPRMIPMSLDPPEHLQYRRLMMSYFEPRSIRRLEESARGRAEALIAAAKAKGGTEFVEEIAGPLPIKVFMEFAGFPLERYEEFRTLCTDFFATTDAATRVALGQQIVGAVMQLVQAKQAEPGDDLISHLIAEDFQGRKLRTDELVSIGFLLFLAGLDTVTNAMSFGIAHMARNPDFQNELRAHPEKIPAAVDELLRRYTFTHTPRVVLKETELGGVTMKPGEMVWNMLPLYGLSEEVNADPLTVDLDRAGRTHGAFSTGGHVCLGRHLGKMELRVLYEVMLRDLPTFRIDESKPMEPIRGGVIMSMHSLWLTW
ncbi:MAG: cytochrome P450 [Sphingobium sp.]